MALRQNPRASIIVATRRAVKAGQADACVTMGSTGAAMAASSFLLGMAKGVERPALGGPIVGVAPNTCIIDLGANVDSRPRQMLSFGAIGDVFARAFFGSENPRIALLSVGDEAGKGNRQVRETTELFEASGLNFIGNIEANDVPKGNAEVVVCDGFVGNIVLKLVEGLGRELSDHLRARLDGRLPARRSGRARKRNLQPPQLGRNARRRSAVRRKRRQRRRSWRGERPRHPAPPSKPPSSPWKRRS